MIRHHLEVLVDLPFARGENTGNRLDATTLTPSQFAEHHGEPTIGHDDLTHDRARRHGSTVGNDLGKYGGGIQ